MTVEERLAQLEAQMIFVSRRVRWIMEMLMIVETRDMDDFKGQFDKLFPLTPEEQKAADRYRAIQEGRYQEWLKENKKEQEG